MAARVLLLALVVGFLPTPAQSASLEPDKVKPFAEPAPVTISDKAAVRFKPQLKLSGVCHPYPAVDANGDINVGIEPSWAGYSDCGGSELGSQVYARSTWYNDVWAIMYAWYFPKGASYGVGQSNVWEYAIIWIDNPDLESPTIKGVTLRSDKGTTEKHAPVDSKYIDGTSFRVKYVLQGRDFAHGDNERGRVPGSHYVGTTPRCGEDGSEQHLRLYVIVRYSFHQHLCQWVAILGMHPLKLRVSTRAIHSDDSCLSFYRRFRLNLHSVAASGSFSSSTSCSWSCARTRG